ncbi:MAG: DNA mismatch repair protein MutS [Proteobacteria bacterium]|nr:DNA mismatch repair protein MutS [Pseudomonadota bacterium]
MITPVHQIDDKVSPAPHDHEQQLRNRTVNGSPSSRGSEASSFPNDFGSILFARIQERANADVAQAPPFFIDLNLDQVVDAITLGKDEYNLKPLYRTSLTDVDSILYRHEVMQDLESATLLNTIKAFAKGMRTVRTHLSEIDKRYYEHQRERWFLDAVLRYVKVMSRFSERLSQSRCRSRGLIAFTGYLSRYVASPRFTSLKAEATQIDTALSAIRYNIYIRGPRVEVHHHANEAEYSLEVAAAFERFRQSADKAHEFKFDESADMNHIEARILDGVAELHRQTFAQLAAFRTANSDFLDASIVSFDREVQFYVAYLEYVSGLKETGLHFCYPLVEACRTDVHCRGGFDLALATKLVHERSKVVCNDFYLKGAERIIVVSGPNQGGKTTFARMFGQLHYLASIGCPVPGISAQLQLHDRIFTHFERQEQMTALRGKLEDDVVRMHEILEAATPRSVVIINEVFASTSLQDAIFLSKRVAARIMDLDVLSVWVTFLDEIASLGERTVSMVSTVLPDNPARRTFTIIRQPANGLAYALSIADKYRLTYPKVTERLGS